MRNHEISLLHSANFRLYLVCEGRIPSGATDTTQLTVNFKTNLSDDFDKVTFVQAIRCRLGVTDFEVRVLKETAFKRP